MFVKGPFLNTVPGVKAGQWSLLGNELWHRFVLVHAVKCLGESVAGKAGRQVMPQTGIFSLKSFSKQTAGICERSCNLQMKGQMPFL